MTHVNDFPKKAHRFLFWAALTYLFVSCVFCSSKILRPSVLRRVVGCHATGLFEWFVVISTSTGSPSTQ